MSSTGTVEKGEVVLSDINYNCAKQARTGMFKVKCEGDSQRRTSSFFPFVTLILIGIGWIYPSFNTYKNNQPLQQKRGRSSVVICFMQTQWKAVLRAFECCPRFYAFQESFRRSYQTNLSFTGQYVTIIVLGKHGSTFELPHANHGRYYDAIMKNGTYAFPLYKGFL